MISIVLVEAFVIFEGSASGGTLPRQEKRCIPPSMCVDLHEPNMYTSFIGSHTFLS